MLEVKDVSVAVENKVIVKNISLVVKPSSLHILMGPNGSGKSSLAMAITGHPRYKVVEGRIFLDGEDITDETPEERASKGLAIAFQRPPEVPIKFWKMLSLIKEKFGNNVEDDALIKKVGLSREVLDRQLNVGFSGGESKRAELAQILAMRPKYVIMDEPDSGLDVEGVRLVAKIIEDFIRNGIGVLLITHLGRVMDHISNVNDVEASVLVKGSIVARGGIDLVRYVEENGYERWANAEQHN
jgi:Fe-S cluster assembly ATP-binding protein